MSPKAFFIECDPWQVIENENAAINQKQTGPCHGDLELLRSTQYLEADGLEPIKLRGIFSYAAGNSELGNRLERMGDVFIERVKKLQDEFSGDDEFQKKVRQTPTDPKYQRATRHLLREILRPCIADANFNPGPNDAADFYHTIVPSSYCNYVLVDGRWTTFAKQAIERLQKKGHKSEMAKVFSEKEDGINQVLSLLAS